MTDPEPLAATRQDLIKMVRLLLGITTFAMMSAALTFGVGAFFLASTHESRSGLGLCVVLAVASGATALVGAVGLMDPHLQT